MDIRLTPARRWGIGFLFLSAGCFAVWLETNAADDWMPNAAVTAIGLGLTVTLVEWIVRREAEVRLGPRINHVRDWLLFELEMFCETVALDYARTHRETYRPIPADMLELLEQWHSDYDRRDSEPRRMDGVPEVIHFGLELEDALQRSRRDDREVMDAELVAAIDQFLASHALTAEVAADAARGVETPKRRARSAERDLVSGAIIFGTALLKWSKFDDPLRFDQQFVDAMSRRASRDTDDA